MTEPFGSAVDRGINSDFVEGRTMSFSLCAMVAKHSKKQNSQPQTGLRPGADASAIHGRFGCSGCTPAEPYPPNRANENTQPMWGNETKKAKAAADLIQKPAQTVRICDFSVVNRGTVCDGRLIAREGE